MANPHMPGPHGPGKFAPTSVTWNKKQIMFFLQHFWPYLRPHRLTLGTVLLAIVLSIIFQLLGPLLVARIINQYIATQQFEALAPAIVILIAFYFLSHFFTWLHDFLIAKSIPALLAQIRHEAYQKLQTLPLQFYDQQPFGEVMSLLTNDLDNLESALTSTTTQIIASILSVIGAVFLMFYQNASLALITFVTVPIAIFSSRTVARTARQFFSQQQKKLAEINGYAEEILQAMPLIKSYGKEKFICQKFNRLANQYYHHNWRASFFSSLMMISILTVNNLNFVLLALVGGHLLFAGLLQIGVLASFLQYQRQFARPLGTLANQFMTLQLAVISGERIMKIFTYQSETNPQLPLRNLTLQDELTCHQLDFAYQENQSILQQINFSARLGQIIAVVGPTGSGKTTLAHLLLRFYDPTSGKITFDSQDVTQAQRETVRHLIGVVLQEVHLFSGTIADNIRFGKPDASLDKVIKASQEAQADDFIRHLPQGYQTKIKGNATNLSQGEKQLIALARVFLLNPPMLILDEATSNIDTLTEFTIQKAMKKLTQARLSLVIAHRLSTVKEADLILVMKKGQLIEQGNHQTLLAQKGFYAQIYQAQDADLLINGN